MSPSPAWSPGSAGSCGWSSSRACTSSCRSIASLPVDRRLLYSRPAEAEYLTADKKNVVIRSLALWRIADPRRFLETLATRANAEIQLADVVLAEIGAALGNYPFASFVSSGDQAEPVPGPGRRGRRRGRRPTRCRPIGIEVLNVDVRQLSLPEQNQQSVFERMKAERGKIAKQLPVRGRARRQPDDRRGRRREDPDRGRGLPARPPGVKAEGDAEAMRIYADAFGKDAPFYKFLRTLQAYETVLDERTTLFLPADAEVLADPAGRRRRPQAAPASGPARRSPDAATIWPADRAPRPAESRR